MAYILCLVSGLGICWEHLAALTPPSIFTCPYFPPIWKHPGLPGLFAYWHHRFNSFPLDCDAGELIKNLRLTCVKTCAWICTWSTCDSVSVCYWLIWRHLMCFPAQLIWLINEQMKTWSTRMIVQLLEFSVGIWVWSGVGDVNSWRCFTAPDGGVGNMYVDKR